ncbi:MAG: 4'-phosphopantetheinyl transferase superfamily protein [Corallococcus sp.]|nr:4'-phosphopantetheinyl transferase superfamily protein [Corallococcus sp.]
MTVTECNTNQNITVYRNDFEILCNADILGCSPQERDVCICVFCSFDGGDCTTPKVSNAMRQRDIDCCTDAKTRMQKFAAWKALEYALKLISADVSADDLSKSADGVWRHSELFVSLSHTENAAAAAVAYAPVGVDTEKFVAARFGKRLAERILTQTEAHEYLLLNPIDREKFVIAKWTAKESLFKQNGKGVFAARNIETNCGKCATAFISDNRNDKYCLSIAATAKKIKLLTLNINEICN